MRVKTKHLLVALLYMVLLSCKEEAKKTPDDSAIRYRYFNLEKSGWRSRNHTERLGELTFSAAEVPVEYYILKEEGNTDLLKVDSLYEMHKNERIIEFTFRSKDDADVLESRFTNRGYSKAVEYMSFGIENDFSIVTEKHDTIKCAGVLFERNFKIAPFSRVILFFGGVPPKDKIQLVYRDKLFKKGTIKFQFNDPIIAL
ncbi:MULTISPECIES: hypothetical protein [unclassified Flavobacterium]|uniref:hypothetical protein n=1 Tax=unclassified Flavobacterium TaxID=196869 RepID=UPI001F13711D|nr:MULTISPECIES: hypothetical protein [unclassified Flavobacterium]UMY66243.1 hypothetical protein MKO97_02365 [Flavobacterium sp. HJ-32-4]